MGDPFVGYERFVAAGAGADPGPGPNHVEDVASSRDDAVVAHAQAAAHGTQEGLRARPYHGLWRGWRGGLRARGGGLRRLHEERRGLYDPWGPYDPWGIAYPLAPPLPVVSRPAVSVGFGRFIPYNEVAAVESGGWSWFPVLGGLRIAFPLSVVQRARDPYALAQTVANAPLQYGYVLQGDTFVPAGLAPGDRHLLATAGALSYTT